MARQPLNAKRKGVSEQDDLALTFEQFASPSDAMSWLVSFLDEWKGKVEGITIEASSEKSALEKAERQLRLAKAEFSSTLAPCCMGQARKQQNQALMAIARF